MTSEADALDARRRHLVEVAARLLATDGPHGLSLRRVATLAGGSTQMVYTLFGGKPGLGDALYREGFRRLGAAMSHSADVHDALHAARPGAPVPSAGDPERLVALGHGYRRFALDEPAMFSVMFGRAIPGFTPTRGNRAAGRAETFGQVVATAEHCLAAGTLVGDDALQLARACWVTAHGLASLELAGLLAVDDADGFADTVLRAPVDARRPR